MEHFSFWPARGGRVWVLDHPVYQHDNFGNYTHLKLILSTKPLFSFQLWSNRWLRWYGKIYQSLWCPSLDERNLSRKYVPSLRSFSIIFKTSCCKDSRKEGLDLIFCSVFLYPYFDLYLMLLTHRKKPLCVFQS